MLRIHHQLHIIMCGKNNLIQGKGAIEINGKWDCIIKAARQNLMEREREIKRKIIFADFRTKVVHAKKPNYVICSV